MPLMFPEPPQPPQGAPEWMVTYADMVTLLLTLFVMLVSFSEINREGSYQDLVESMQDRFGVAESRSSQDGSLRHRHAAMAAVAVAARGHRELLLESSSVSQQAAGSAASRTLAATIPPFDTDAPPPVAREQLAEVAARITGTSGAIELHSIEGADQLDRAIRRAQACRNQLITLGIAADRLRVSAAEWREQSDSSSEAKENRQTARLELYLLESHSPERATAR